VPKCSSLSELGLLDSRICASRPPKTFCQDSSSNHAKPLIDATHSRFQPLMTTAASASPISSRSLKFSRACSYAASETAFRAGRREDVRPLPSPSAAAVSPRRAQSLPDHLHDEVDDFLSCRLRAVDAPLGECMQACLQ
jgi:hypothetical protein